MIGPGPDPSGPAMTNAGAELTSGSVRTDEYIQSADRVNIVQIYTVEHEHRMAIVVTIVKQ